jgi:outer membrane protein TolC
MKNYPPKAAAKRALKSLFLIIPSLLVLAGCAVQPEPLEKELIIKTNQQDKDFAYFGAPRVDGAITLEEAVARALKYNLEHRVRIYEHAIAVGQLELGQYDMMPSLLTKAGYTWRDKENSRYSDDGSDSTSTEKSHATTDLGFYWNLLDFGLGYYNAKESADNALIAVEKRRRAMHNLVQEVETTFWRAAAAQQLQSRVSSAIEQGESALQRSRAIATANIRRPEEALQYQRHLLENLRLLENVNRELMSASSQLATLIGEQPSTHIQLIIPENGGHQLIAPIAQLEELALINNPDLRIKHYESRIAVVETQRTLLKMLPNLSFSYGFRSDDDSFLKNSSWQDAGMQVSYNLLNILTAPKHKKIAEMGVSLASAKRAALQMSLLTQLHLSLQEYHHASSQYQRARDIHHVDNQLAKLALSKQQSAVASDLDRISSEVTSILSEVRHYHALAKVREAESRIQATVGLEPKMGNLDQIPLPALVDQLRVSLKSDTLFSADENSQSAMQIARNAGPKPAKKTLLGHRDTWLQLGAYKAYDNAELAQNRAMAVLRHNKNILAVLSAPNIEKQQDLYLVRFGPFLYSHAERYAMGLKQLLNKPVAVITTQ